MRNHEKAQTIVAVILWLAAIGWLSSAVGCTPQARAAVARTIADIAAEVCVEGDSVSVCLRKCETEASRRADEPGRD